MLVHMPAISQTGVCRRQQEWHVYLSLTQHQQLVKQSFSKSAVMPACKTGIDENVSQTFWLHVLPLCSWKMTCLSCQPYLTAVRLAAHTIIGSRATEQLQGSPFLWPCQNATLWGCRLAWSCKTPCSCRLTPLIPNKSFSAVLHTDSPLSMHCT